MDISVIIPVRNGQDYLKQCLDSVFNQTFKGSYEVILGIDPSSDDTLKIAKEYQKDHPNLIVEERRGLGVQYNRIDSIKKAKGKYLCFLDGDDYYHETFLEKMFSEIEKGYDVVNCSFKVDTNGKLKNNIFSKNVELDSCGACKALLQDSYIRGFLWNKIFKRELFENKLPIFKAKDAMFEDVMVVYTIFSRCNIVKSIKNPLYIYRNNGASATKSEKKERFEYHLFVFAYIRYLCDLNNDKKYLYDYIKTFKRSKLSLWYDAHASRHVLGNGGCKELRRHKQIINELRSKQPFSIDRYPKIKQFIENSLDGE